MMIPAALNAGREQNVFFGRGATLKLQDKAAEVALFYCICAWEPFYT